MTGRRSLVRIAPTSLQGIEATIAKVRSTLTSDPLKSNDVVSSIYDANEFLTAVSNAGKDKKPMDMLRGNLTSREAERAADDASDMTHKGGIVYETKKKVTEWYAEIDDIESDLKLTEEQKQTLTREIRRKMIDAVLDANEEVAEFYEAYVNGETFVTRFMKGAVVQ